MTGVSSFNNFFDELNSKFVIFGFIPVLRGHITRLLGFVLGGLQFSEEGI